MIKVILVRLDGTPGDEFRLGACEGLAKLFDAHVIGLFLNVLPEPTLADAGTTADFWTGLLDQARERGKRMEAEFASRLRDTVRSAECRRFDVYPYEQARVTARECRTADAFVGLRLSDTDDTLERRDVVEEVLFDSGRHLFLVGDQTSFEHGFAHALIAWNRSREAARAVTEALPYLLVSRKVTVVMIDQGNAPEFPGGEELVGYLHQHGIRASINITKERGRDTASALLEAIGEQNADLVVMGGYGHSRLREWLLGGVTYKFLRKSTVPLIIAH